MIKLQDFIDLLERIQSNVRDDLAAHASPWKLRSGQLHYRDANSVGILIDFEVQQDGEVLISGLRET